jgi:hypothetical protein
MLNMKLYLAGKIPKGGEIGNISDWRIEYARELNKIPNFSIIDPLDPTLDESKPLLVFGHDCHLVQEADVLLVNASEKLGAGTAQEMVIAKYFRKPVVTILPKSTHHRRTNLSMHAGVVSDWIHPFIFSTSDAIFENISETVEWLVNYQLGSFRGRIKGMEVIDSAIRTYLDASRP